jgi:protein TonB
MHQEGDCVVKLYVTPDGALTDMAVSKSTGFATLDQACISAVQGARFKPAMRDDAAVGAWTKINISWRLPPQ